MTTYRTTSFDPDYRHEAKENPCCACGKSIKGRSKLFVHVIRGGSTLLHPEDEALFKAEVDDPAFGGDLGALPIGPDCAKKYPGFTFK